MWVEPIERRANVRTLTVLLNCIIFFGFGLVGQGVVLGAEDVTASLLLSTDTGASEEAGGSQGSAQKIEAVQNISSSSQQAGVTEPRLLSGAAAPVVSLVNPVLSTASAIVRSVDTGVNEKAAAEKTSTKLVEPVVDIAAGHVRFVSDVVQATDMSGNVRILHKGDAVSEGDTIATAKNSSAEIVMADGGSIALRPETMLKLENFKFNGNEDGSERSFIALMHGGFRAVTGMIGTTNKQNYRISTPVATIGVLGTDHEVVYLPEEMRGIAAGVYNMVNAGATVLTTDVGSIRVGLNQMGYAGGRQVLPQIQPVVSSLFADNQASGLNVKAGSLAPSAGSTPATPIPSAVALSSTNTVAANGEAQKNGEVKYSVPAKEKPAEIRSPKGFRFGLAPIFWGGDMSETLTKNFHADGTASISNVQKINVRARTYIWQPSLVQVGGGIGLVRSKDSSSSLATSGYTALVGNGSLAVLPSSRFPFSASFSAGDNRSNYALAPVGGSVYRSVDLRQSYRPISNTSSSVATYLRNVSSSRYLNSQVGNTSTLTRWTLRHDYSPPNSVSRYGIGYDRNVWNTVENGGNASWGLQGNYSTRFDKQSLSVDARRSESFYALNGADYTSSGATARHDYRPDARLSVNSSANLDQSNQSTNKTYNTRYLQANTSSSWQPDQDLPLYVTASGRVYDSSSEQGGVLNTSQNQVVSAGARYAHTRNMSYALDGSVANSKSNGLKNRSVTETGGFNYVADPIKFGDASYSRNANGSLGFQSNSNSPSNRTVTGGAGHGLAVPYQLDGGASLNFGMNESLLARNDRLTGQNRTLSHAGSAMWQPVPRGTLTGAVSANVSDIRNVGGDENLHYQAASVGANVQDPISANSSMRASASMQWASDRLSQHSSVSANANLEYRHARAFDVKGLRYVLTFNMNKQQSRTPSIGTQLAYSDTTASSSLDQGLDYGIGRTNVRLSLSLAKYGKATSKSVMLHLGRSFGRL